MAATPPRTQEPDRHTQAWNEIQQLEAYLRVNRRNWTPAKVAWLVGKLDTLYAEVGSKPPRRDKEGNNAETAP